MEIKNKMKYKFLFNIGFKNMFYGKKIFSLEESNQKIYNLLKSDNPIMISRIGSVELECISSYHIKNSNFNLKNKKEMQKNAGFFPVTSINLIKFSKIFLESLMLCDFLGIWFNKNEDVICKEFCKNSNLGVLRGLEPYYSEEPWSRYLEDKKILIIHPFEKTIISKYKKRALLFENKKILPNFELQTIKAVQSIGGNSKYKNWFEGYDYMCKEISKKDFDIALIGAGAYGLPLAAYVKNIGKQAIHLGGATQIIFGIKGKRWDNHPVISTLYNEHW